MQLSEINKKEIQRGEFSPQEGQLQSTGTTKGAGLWSRGGRAQAKGPQRASNESSIPELQLWDVLSGGATQEAHEPTTAGGEITPNLPAGGAEGSCPHPSLWAPYPRPETLPATRSRHVPQSTQFALWPQLNFKKQLWLWDQASQRAEKDTTSPWHGFWGVQCPATWLAEGSARTMSI